jgi:hypothetical protein
MLLVGNGLQPIDKLRIGTLFINMENKSLHNFIKRKLPRERSIPFFKSPSLRNIRIKKHSVDVRLHQNFKSKNKTFELLCDAIEYRNEMYKQWQVVNGLFIDESPRYKDFLIIENVNKERWIQINTRKLATYRINPVMINVGEFSSDVEAKQAANNILVLYSKNINMIINLYNKNRTQWFNELALKELKTLKPHIPAKIEFDYNLWRHCYKEKSMLFINPE